MQQLFVNKFICFVLIITLTSCKKNNQNVGGFNSVMESVKSVSEVKYISSILKDTSEILKKSAVDKITVSNQVSEEVLFSLCNCEKSINDNSIKIQITTAIPTKEDILSGKRENSLLNMNSMERFKGQMKFLTIHVKDSIVEQVSLISKSTDNDYNGTNFSTIQTDKFRIQISTFDYTIASEVYGNYAIIFSESFGYFPNDTILKGTFKCNNWRINTIDDIKNLNLESSNSKKGFQVNK